MEPPDPEAVTSLDDFIAFVGALAGHFEAEREGDDWQHWYIGDYLDAMAHWLRADHPQMPGETLSEIYREAPTWRGVANILDAARVYE